MAHYTLPLLIAVVAMGFGLVLPALGFDPSALEYHRDAVANGEWWRLLTGHLVHHSRGHLAGNVAVWVVLAGYSTYRWGSTLLLKWLIGLSIGISTGLFFWVPDMTTYRGLSALNYALLVPVLLAAFPRQRPQPDTRTMNATAIVRALVIPGLIGICLVPLWHPQGLFINPAVTDSVRIAWQSHLLGVGLMAVPLLLNRFRRRHHE